jgi:hypothetical protein
MARCIGVFRAGANFGSETSSHDNFFAMDRTLARQRVGDNFVHKAFVADSSQRTQARALPRDLKNDDHSTYNPIDVKRAVHRVRNSGSVAPKKKGAIKK